MTSPVLFDLLACDSGHDIGVATLNKPDALNALNLDMVNLLLDQLVAWQHNDKVAMVVIDSCSDKAFCAGGDVVSMYRAMHENSQLEGYSPNSDRVPELLQTFFSQEYRLDYLIHTYNKPILLWGHGIIMGGGLGLMAGASHRVVTETSRIAMPEVSIGLYPDVGGSWFLNRMPTGCGRFLGTTGASINAQDSLYVNLADHYIQHAKKSSLLSRLQQTTWQNSATDNARLLTEACDQYSDNSTQDSQVRQHQGVFDELEQHASVDDYVDALKALVTDDKWLTKAISAVDYGSPITMHLVQQQLLRGNKLSLADCFKMELIMSCRCGIYGEFQEGVRALLIDKDRNPDWSFKLAKEVEPSVIESFFQSPWTDQHPLADLDQNPSQTKS